jgi:hypothetical protein
MIDMGRPSALPALRRLQHRFSIVLSAALCLWMLALATHVHTGDYEEDSHQGTHALCAFCVSVPTAGAAPTVVAFIVTAQPQSFSAPADIVPTALAPAAAAYYSRGPPLV